MGVQVLSKVESNLQCIIYLSTATKSMTDVEIEDLLVSARKFNATQNVTGILFYLDGNFVQYIEGTEDALPKIPQSPVSSGRGCKEYRRSPALKFK